MDEMTDVLAQVPWYIKWALAFGLGGLLWKWALKRIPDIFACLTPKAVSATGLALRALLTHPIARVLIVANKAEVRAAAKAILDGLEALLEAVEAEIDKDLAEANGKAPEPSQAPPEPQKDIPHS